MTAKTFKRHFGYTDEVLKGKPTHRIGEDRRELPTYTIPEAAIFLGVSPRTAQYWFCAENEILTPSGRIGEVGLLSFLDISEAYVLALLTRFYGFHFAALRDIIENAKKETGLQRPLIQADLKVLFNNLVIEKPARGRRPRQMVDVAHHRNLVFPEFVDQLGRRILRDRLKIPLRIYPWRLASASDDSTPVSMDPDVVSGRLVVTGTRIPVRVLLGRKIAGKSVEEIALSYRIGIEAVRKALQHIDRPIHQEAA